MSVLCEGQQGPEERSPRSKHGYRMDMSLCTGRKLAACA